MALTVFDQELAHPKRFREGTHRTRSPTETLAEYLPRMRQFGITRLANITGLDCIGLPVIVSIRPNSRSLACSQGKGVDMAAAKASALMEAIELWHAENIDLPLRFESYRSLRDVAHVADITKLPVRPGRIVRVDVPMLWIEGYDLLQRRAIWLPFDSVTINLAIGDGPRSSLQITSNGLASGNHLLEAIVHGLCEVIERDAVAEGTSSQCVDLASVDDPACRHVLDLVARANAEFRVYDVTSDTNVPTYRAALASADARTSWRRLGVAEGFGSHLSPAIAFLRATTEAVQSRLTLIAGSRDDLYREKYATFRAADRWPEVDATACRLDGRASRDGQTFEDDAATLLEDLRRIGIESVGVVDLTKKDVGIPVVRIVVPGLTGSEHGAGHAPQRRPKMHAQ